MACDFLVERGSWGMQLDLSSGAAFRSARSVPKCILDGRSSQAKAHVFVFKSFRTLSYYFSTVFFLRQNSSEVSGDFLFCRAAAISDAQRPSSYHQIALRRAIAVSGVRKFREIL